MTSVNARRRLLFVTSRFPFGAKELFLQEEIEQLSHDHDVFISPALPEDQPVCAPWLEPITFQRLSMTSWRTFALALRTVLRAPLRVVRTSFAVIAAPRSKRAKIKNALILPKAFAVAEQARLKGIDHVHAYWLSAPATIAYVVSRLNGIPWSATGHRYDLVDFNITSIGVPNAGFVRTATFVRAISKRGLEQIRMALARGYDGDRIVLEHLGVRLPERVSANGSLELRLLCTAGMERIKGHDTLLDALAQARNEGALVHCTFAGTGSLRKPLEERAFALGLGECVSFRGVVPHHQLLKELSEGAYGGAILTSRDEGPDFCEGIPVSLIEAMAAGLPVIATRSGAIGELVDESNGMLCDPEDSRAIAKAIVRLALDPQLRRALGERGRRRVAHDFDIAETSPRIAARIFPEAYARLGLKAPTESGERGRSRLRLATLPNPVVRTYNRDDAGIP